MKQHKHSTLKMLHAQGAKIQGWAGVRGWVFVENPSWGEKEDYRLKPETHSPGIYAIAGLERRANMKIPYKGFEISIAMDDGLGAFKNYHRSDLIIVDDYGVVRTDRFTDDTQATAENLIEIFSRIDTYTKGQL